MPTQLTVADVVALLASPAESPVLYLDTERGEPRVDVWAEALAPHGSIIVRRHELVDAIGEEPDTDTIREHLPELQSILDDLG